jgi:TPR repeat protein
MPQDYAQAHHWYSQAAGQGHLRAQFNLGLMYLVGQGVRADVAQAWLWLAMAERGGFGAAERYLKTAASRMDGEQLAQARQRLQAPHLT